MDPATEIQLLDQLINYMPRIRTIPYLSMACLVWHSYDWAINFERERKYIWIFDFTVMAVRETSIAFCLVFAWQACINMGILIMIIEILLQGRVYALYAGDKRILYINAGFYVISAAGTAIGWWQELPTIFALEVPEPLTGCWVFAPRFMALALLPPLTFELWLFILVAWKALGIWKARRALPTEMTSGTVSWVVVRDYLAWFIAAFLGVLANIFIFLFVPDVYNYCGIALFHAFMCIGACRMILNILEAYVMVHRPETQGPTNMVSASVGVFGGHEAATRQTTATIGFAAFDRTTFMTEREGSELASDDMEEAFQRNGLHDDEKAYVQDV